MDNCSQILSMTQVGPGGSQWVPDPPDVVLPAGGRPGGSQVGPPFRGDPPTGTHLRSHSATTHLRPKTQPAGTHPGTHLSCGPDSTPRGPAPTPRPGVMYGSRVYDSWTPMAEVCDAVAQAQGLKTKTVSGMIRTARDGGHLMIRGRYARKTGTRMIRRHPRAAA